MAKTTKITSQAYSLLQRLKKTSSIEESSVYSESDFFTTKESIPIPIPILNLALSGKFFDIGITRGSTVIAGESRSFKTLSGLMCLKAYMDKYEDSVGMIYDSEFSMTPDYLETFGIDTNRIFITPITDLDKLKNDIINQIDAINNGEHVFILIDSIGNLASLKEVSDAQDGKSSLDMTRAKMIKSFFRMVTPRVNLKNIPLFTINHIYQTQELYSKSVISGGTGILLSANSAIIISRRKNQNKEEEGFEFVIKIEKSRFIKEGLKFPLVIPSNGKIKKWSGMFDLALEYGFITQSGAWYEVPCLTEYEGKKIRKSQIENNDDFWKKIFEETNFKETVEENIKVSQTQSDIFESIEQEIEDDKIFSENTGMTNEDN